VNDLGRIGIDDDAERNGSLRQLLPEESHLGLLLGNAPLQPKRAVAGLEGVGVGNRPVSPCRFLKVELVAVVAPVEMIVAKPDQRFFEKLVDILESTDL
jgi:hypothetical protein